MTQSLKFILKQPIPLKIEINPDQIRILEGDQEIASWIADEWIADPSLVSTIVYAVQLALTAPEGLRKLVSMSKSHQISHLSHL